MRFTEIVLSGIVVWKRIAKRLLLHGLSGNVCWTQLGSICGNSLPSHVRQVLGPKKNLLLLREMLVAAGYADETLVADLAQGFPLIGKLPRSGTLPKVSYPLVEETRESLLWAGRLAQ